MSEGIFFHPMTSQQNDRWYICKWSSLASQPLPLLHNTTRGKVSGITMKVCAESDCRSDQSNCRMYANSFTAHTLKGKHNNEYHYNILLQRAG